MSISAQLVKELREITGAGMMECKKALIESNGNIDNAVKHLKEKGITKATEKRGRTTKEGIITISVSGDRAGIVEVNCETDFVAKTDEFINSCNKISTNILEANIADPSALTKDIENQINSLIAKLGENISISRINLLKANKNGYIDSYIHSGNKIGVVVIVDTNKKESHNNDEFISLIKNVCMHIAAMNPRGLIKDDIDSNLIEEQKAIFLKQAKDSGKPEKVIEKIVQGKLNQFFKETVLLEQSYVKEPKLSVNKLIESTGKKLGENIKIVKFIRFRVGG